MKNTKKGEAGLRLAHGQIREALMRTLGINERLAMAFSVAICNLSVAMDRATSEFASFLRNLTYNAATIDSKSTLHYRASILKKLLYNIGMCLRLCVM